MEDIVREIQNLKKQRQATILAHYYQWPEVQDVADLVGDSLELAKAAARTEAEVIVLCGVHFMAESAALLAPEKTVLLPEASAGCPMADMVGEEQLVQWKEAHPQAKVVAYVNTSAAVKALSDVCCTSANAVQVVSSFPKEEKVLFLPDRNLGAYVAAQTGRELELWPGWCNTHEKVSIGDLQSAKKVYPQAIVLAHPECRAEVLVEADQITSTAGMIRFAQNSTAEEFLIVTEEGVLHRLRQACPEKKFHLASSKLFCPNMKKTSLRSVLAALKNRKPVVEVTPALRQPALQSLQRMLELS